MVENRDQHAVLGYESKLKEDIPQEGLGCSFILLAIFSIPPFLVGSWLIVEQLLLGRIYGAGLANLFLLILVSPCIVFGLMAFDEAGVRKRSKRIVVTMLAVIGLTVAVAFMLTIAIGG